MLIGWNGAQSQILDWTTDGKVVEALPIVTDQTERAVQHLIEVAAHAGAANTGSLENQAFGAAAPQHLERVCAT